MVRADRRAGIPAGGLLVDGDGGRKAVDGVNIRLVHLAEEHPRVARQRLLLYSSYFTGRFGLRGNLEMTALRYFDCEFTEEDLRTLRGILEEMRNVRPGDLSQIVENDNRFHAVIVQRAGLPRLLKFWDDLNYGNLLVGVSSGSNHETLAQRQNGIHTKLYEALASGDTEAACRAVYAHYMEPMERMRSANIAGQAADGTAK